jgi:hypothetical protein
MIVVHVRCIGKRWFYYFTNSLQPPKTLDDVDLFGPFPTKADAAGVARETAREILGTQCRVTEVGTLH